MEEISIISASGSVENTTVKNDTQNEASIDDSPSDILERKVEKKKSRLSNESLFVIRRSTRDPSLHLLERRDVKDLLHAIEKNKKNTVVLKIKQFIVADINEAVLDAILNALERNTVCQALYIQNFSNAFHDSQMKHLITILKQPNNKIWGINLGENYEISIKMWHNFCDNLKETNITHLYVSEHIIPITLKNKMREIIRNNRQKHNMHCAIENLSVIEQCTHMWW
jgi:hypothetical protein